jgi:hypothetical protein
MGKIPQVWIHLMNELWKSNIALRKHIDETVQRQRNQQLKGAAGGMVEE